MKLVVRSLVVLAVGCVLAAGCYFALGSIPASALGGLGAEHGHRGGPPTGFAAAGLRPPADAPEFGLDGDADGGRGRVDGRLAHGGREGRDGGAGVLGVLKDVSQIAIVTVLVGLLGWALRSRGRRRMDPAPDLA